MNFDWISVKPLIWFHYIPLIVVQWIYLYLTIDFVELSPIISVNFVLFVVGWFFVIALSDMIIHKILNVD